MLRQCKGTSNNRNSRAARERCSFPYFQLASWHCNSVEGSRPPPCRDGFEYRDRRMSSLASKQKKCSPQDRFHCKRTYYRTSVRHPHPGRHLRPGWERSDRPPLARTRRQPVTARKLETPLRSLFPRQSPKSGITHQVKKSESVSAWRKPFTHPGIKHQIRTQIEVVGWLRLCRNARNRPLAACHDGNSRPASNNPWHLSTCP